MRDWGAGRGALLGGLVGIIGGPVGMIAGGAISGAVAKPRDTGFKDDQLRQLGKSLAGNSSAVVVELASDTVAAATDLLKSLDAQQIVTQDIDSSVADLFASDPTPEAEPDPAATAAE